MSWAGNLPLAAAGAVALVGLAGVLWSRNLIRMLMGMTLVESAVNLFLVSLGYRHDAVAPIYTGGVEAGTKMVLPTVQALTLTAIVIGLATTAMMLAMVMKIHRHYGSCDVEDMRRLKG